MFQAFLSILKVLYQVLNSKNWLKLFFNIKFINKIARWLLKISNTVFHSKNDWQDFLFTTNFYSEIVYCCKQHDCNY